ncbi:hypothetical protein RchiOBHm_Chr3g0462721 [Rosa chinensis]|uniref:Uncharacterized protein n=1 Tax=Rosa chinensis TaxID=74649 RepID=A0A2P6R903_ROSCH|nr:hypothetical protein RchiOBHm_Chr3g0462721 [Rosa chinensis]
MFKFSGLPSLRYLEILTRMKVDVDNKLDSIPVSRLNTEKEIRVETRICRVPEKLRELKEDAYNPRVVSIGPFHSCKDYLAPMSRHKYYYMSLLIHSKDAENCLDECICAITDFDVVIRQCYVEDISVSNDELRLMMLVDGCFILELLLRLAPNLEYIMPQEYESDPLINNAWMIRALWHDLALLENQIPFFILEKLYDIIKPRLMSKCRAPDSVTSLVLSFFKPMMSQNSNIEEHSYPDCKHLLDLLHKCPLLAASGVDTAFTESQPTTSEMGDLELL